MSELLFAGKSRAEFIGALSSTKKAELRRMLEEQGVELPVVVGGYQELLGACFDVLAARPQTDSASANVPPPKAPVPAKKKASEPPPADPAPSGKPAGGPRFRVSSTSSREVCNAGRWTREGTELAESALSADAWDALRKDPRVRVVRL